MGTVDLSWDQWLSVAGSIASLVALPASVYAAVAIRSVKRRLLFQMRAETFLAVVGDTADWLLKAESDFPANAVSIDGRLKICLAEIEASRAGLTPVQRRIWESISRMFRSYRTMVGGNTSNVMARKLIVEIAQELSVLHVHVSRMVEARRLGVADDE